MSKARILVATHVAGIPVACGAAIEADAKLIAELVALGEADDHPDAVAYAEDTAPAIVIAPASPGDAPPVIEADQPATKPKRK